MDYTVAPGDTIDSISQQFKIPTETLLTYNNLTPNSILTPGIIIVIPPIFPPIIPPIYPPQNRIYIVRRGDTIWSIARMFRVSVQSIMYVNRLKFPVVFPGQRLIIPMRIVPL